jgi:uncharacterized protein
VPDDAQITESRYLSQKERLLALSLYVALLFIINTIVTGETFPTSSGRRLWILSAIGFWVFTLISAPWFRPPRDSLANAISAGLLMSLLDLNDIDVLREPLNTLRWCAVLIALLTVGLAVAAMAFREANPLTEPRRNLFGRLSYRLSDTLGKGEILFTPPVLLSIVGYYQSSIIQQMWLLLVWVFIAVAKPVELTTIRLIDEVRSAKQARRQSKNIGTIARIDSPNIVRVNLASAAEWSPNSVATACLPDGNQVSVLCMFCDVQEAQFVGTGLVYGPAREVLANGIAGQVYRPDDAGNVDDILKELSGAKDGANLIGFAVEDSSIAAIKIEVAPTALLEEGMLTFCRQGNAVVYYQVIDARTAEETFNMNPRGKHVVTATQLGVLDVQEGFVKYGWLPSMNTPVFVPRRTVTFDIASPKPDEFAIGTIPGSDVAVRASLFDLLEYHGAILGVTGTGKTELAFDLIRKALELNVKVFCVDFTNEYSQRLSDQSPQPLGLDEKLAAELDQKLFAVETGTYGAPKEKEALKKFVDDIREPVRKAVDGFVSKGGPGLGIFELPEIMNTKATLRATELYLSSIMEWARKNRRARRILIVLEEAHTIIPETFGSGFDADTQFVVSRISQIALQGRKYGVGLLLISQRTALVSKSILSQCNTYVTFSLVDKTSIDYLANVYSSQHVEAIPNLRFLEAVAYGKAIRSERPLLIKLKYDQTKKDASEALTKQVAEKAS